MVFRIRPFCVMWQVSLSHMPQHLAASLAPIHQMPIDPFPVPTL